MPFCQYSIKREVTAEKTRCPAKSGCHTKSARERWFKTMQ